MVTPVSNKYPAIKISLFWPVMRFIYSTVYCTLHYHGKHRVFLYCTTVLKGVGSTVPLYYLCPAVCCGWWTFVSQTCPSLLHASLHRVGVRYTVLCALCYSALVCKTLCNCSVAHITLYCTSLLQCKFVLVLYSPANTGWPEGLPEAKVRCDWATLHFILLHTCSV